MKSLLHLLPVSLIVAAVALTPACRDSESPPKKQSSSSKSTKSKSKKAKPLDKPLAGIDKAVEDFTGAHTRLVWTENLRLKNSDTFAIGDDLMLKGLDTRDGKGERMLQTKTGNYSRPILSSDGEVILFTDKDVRRKGGRKHYDPEIYRTDWQGTQAVRLAEGYAVDCWRDAATGIEWVYAAREFKASSGLSMEAARLVRFRLDDPSVVEVVYDDGPVSPDNIQFSRDGSRASCLFPWPNVGVLTRGKDGGYHARKLETGCWPSLAPDNSGVAWVFDGGHRAATFFSDGGKKSWMVKLNQAPGMGGHEVYHPRWSNHPRYFTVTGPYVPVKGTSGNVINKGGASAEIHIGRFSEKLDSVEAWLQVTDDKLSESFPDMWVDGADDVELAGFAPAGPGAEPAAPAQEAWPAVKDSLVFLWEDRRAVNQFKGGDGRMHSSALLASRDAGRFGRLEEMLVDGGSFQAKLDESLLLLKAMTGAQEATVELCLLPVPPVTGQALPPQRPIFRGPDFTLALAEDGALIAAQDKACLRSAVALPTVPLHLGVVRKAGSFAVFVNGNAVEMVPHATAPPAPAADMLVFGGGWEGGILGVAVHGRALGDAEMKQQAALQMAHLAKLPPAPAQVKVSARLVEASAMPSAEGIAPYTGALVAYVYEVEKVLEGTFTAKSMVVKHWAMLDQRTTAGFPREVGKTYELTLERDSDHPHLKGERVMDDTTAFDLEAWFDVTPPRVP